MSNGLNTHEKPSHFVIYISTETDRHIYREYSYCCTPPIRNDDVYGTVGINHIQDLHEAMVGSKLYLEEEKEVKSEFTANITMHQIWQALE